MKVDLYIQKFKKYIVLPILVSNDLRVFMVEDKMLGFSLPLLNNSEKHNFRKHFDFNASCTFQSKFCLRKKIKIFC